MNRFYKYLKSFDSFVLEFSKPIGRIFSSLAIMLFVFRFIEFDFSILRFKISYDIILWIGLLCLFFINHGLDAFIWRYILTKANITISMKDALKMNWRSLLIGIATPSRIGEIPARRLLLSEYNLEDVYKSASIHYLFKPTSFVILCLFGLLGYYFEFYYWHVLLLVFILLIGFYIFPYYRMSVKLIGLNILRVISYCIQHMFILMIFMGFVFKCNHLNTFVFIHSSGAIIPHVFGTEVFIKSIVYDLIHLNHLSWLNFTVSLFLLWIMNIVLPGLIGVILKKDRI